ncbi:MAG: exodeoxyribonuclease VII small subunit [Cyclobacteriaceae bacterium]
MTNKQFNFEEADQEIEQILDSVTKGEIKVSETYDKMVRAKELVGACSEYLRKTIEATSQLNLNNGGEKAD